MSSVFSDSSRRMEELRETQPLPEQVLREGGEQKWKLIA